MSPFDLNQPTPMPLTEGDQDQGHLAPFTLANDTINTLHDQGAIDRDHLDRDHRFLQQPQQQEPYHEQHQYLISGSNDHLVSFTADNNSYKNHTIKQPSCDVHIRGDDPHGPGEWMSSKMRFMRKMMSTSDRFIMTKQRRNIQVPQDQSQPSQEGSTSSNGNISPCGIVRVCSDCNTTKTPLWRSGPRGPKSLCNACGIRQRKARRAMAAAAASSGLIPTDAPNRARKEKKPEVDLTVPFKKRCKITVDSTTPKRPRLSNYSALRHVFPQDEWDAAILLMALSCGLVLS